MQKAGMYFAGNWKKGKNVKMLILFKNGKIFSFKNGGMPWKHRENAVKLFFWKKWKKIKKSLKKCKKTIDNKDIKW